MDDAKAALAEAAVEAHPLVDDAALLLLLLVETFGALCPDENLKLSRYLMARLVLDSCGQDEMRPGMNSHNVGS